ncbi:glycosyltransferase [Tropicimonas sp. IMCC6043]|nr:glycosyltransferase [Tropicimonas sp. IMCC6043]
MRISIITVVRNRVGTIGQAIESVQSQSYPHVEHVVQDGASTDGTLEIIERLATPSTSLESAPDGGIYEAINRGIERATGDVIGLMHSDDFYAHDAVLTHVAERLETSPADGLYGDLDYVSSREAGRVVRRWKSGSYDRAKLSRGWMPPHPTLYLRREVYDRFGGYDTEFRIAADYEAMMRYLVRGGIALDYLPEVMVKMRLGGESNGSLRRVVRKSREDLRAIRRHELGGVGTLALKSLRKIGQFVGPERRA